MTARFADLGRGVRVAVPIAALAFALPLARAAAQQKPAEADAPESPQVGQIAPDFALPGATRYGPLATPARLSNLRGETVVLAFFFKARTKGWTIQMEAYRDQYAKLFNNGKKVVVFAVSVDPDTTLANWAHESSFPFLFGSDSNQSVGKLYGSTRGKLDSRNLFVIGPDGRITYRVIGFNVLSQDAYAELGRQVARAAGIAGSTASGTGQ